MVNAPDVAPTITIALDSNPDNGVINKAEKGTATTTDVKVGVPAEAKDGDVITVKDAAGNTLATYTVGQAGVTAGSTQTIKDVALPNEGQTLAVTASITNASGVSKEATDSAKLDTTAPEITSLDVNPAGTVITGKTEPDAKVVVTLPNGDKVPVTADKDGNFTINPTTPVDANKPITAVATDEAGNASEPKETTRVVNAPDVAPTITIALDSNPDNGVINKAEKRHSHHH